MTVNAIKHYAVVLHRGHELSATTIEAYALRDAMTMGYDFLMQHRSPTSSCEITVVEIPKEPVP